MARPEKEGLDYFSMDVEKDNKLKLLKAKYGTLGFGLYVEFLQYIYKEGYYIEWNEDNMLLFIAETGLSEEDTKDILNFMLDKGLFNKKLYEKYNIITSNGIQKRYAEGTRKRKNTKARSSFWSVEEYEHIELMSEETELMSEETELMSEESTQSKGKERKGNNNVFFLENEKETIRQHYSTKSKQVGRSPGSKSKAFGKLEKIKNIPFADFLQKIDNYFAMKQSVGEYTQHMITRLNQKGYEEEYEVIENKTPEQIYTEFEKARLGKELEERQAIAEQFIKKYGDEKRKQVLKRVKQKMLKESGYL